MTRRGRTTASRRGTISSPGSSVRGVRPVAAPADPDVIANACESAPYRMRRNVKRYDRFWIKGQPYSVAHMLAGDPWADQFTGGDGLPGVPQRAELPPLAQPGGRPDRQGVRAATARTTPRPPRRASTRPVPNDSQGYITEVATRAMIFIEADNPAIGLMCVLPVGMAEVSTCEITVYEGQHVTKGDQLGMFHFGGSTHCLIFRPGVNLEFDLHGQQAGLKSSNIPVNSQIAKVVR